MDKLLTLAIPAYNMEKYLGRCLESVLLPEISDAVEILLINDGSKDGTLKIAREYEKKHDRVLRVIDKPNGGWGSAINCAVGEAKGKYFKILDSDDWFESDSFIQYIELLNKIDSDVIVTAHKYVFIEGGERCVEYDITQCNQVLDFDCYIRSHNYLHGLNLSNTTFKTKLLTADISERYYADIEYVMKPLARVGTIYFSNINLYRYYIGRDGQSTSIVGYSSHLDDFMAMLTKLISYYESIKQSVSDSIRIMYEIDYSRLVSFGYYLHLSPVYHGGDGEKICKLKSFDANLKKKSPVLYNISAKNKKFKGLVPYIKIWRLTGINILKIRSWI